MNHTATYDIKDKCFTKDKIFSIAKIIYQEFTNQDTALNASIEFKFEFNDNSSYTKNDLSFFDEHNIFESKEITKFEFTFNNNDETNKKYIKFDLTKKPHYISDFLIEGEEIWRDKVYDDLKAIMNFTKSQNKIIKNYFVNAVISFNFLLLSVSILLVSIVLYQTTGIELEKKLLNVQEFILSSLLIPSIIAAMVCALGMQGVIKKFFPSIEFSFGPQYLKNERNKRFIFAAIFSIIILGSSVPFSIATFSGIFS